MYLDLHCHSVVSDDARATVEQYAKWIASLRRKGYRVDGIVLTEHRTFDSAGDYRRVEDAYGLLVLKATELDTDSGHFLLFGVNADLLRRFDFRDVRIPAVELVRLADATGAIAIPAHPGRENTGFVDLMGDQDFSTIRVVETRNGGSRDWENQRSQELAAARGYRGISGSDAHFVNAIAKNMTRFEQTIATIDDLVSALRAGNYEPALLEETRSESVPS